MFVLVQHFIHTDSDYPLMFGEKQELEKQREKYLSKDGPLVRYDIWEIEVKQKEAGKCLKNHF